MIVESDPSLNDPHRRDFPHAAGRAPTAAIVVDIVGEGGDDGGNSRSVTTLVEGTELTISPHWQPSADPTGAFPYNP